MRGPHNIWRLIRTGATFERSGAMKLVLEAIEAPLGLRIAARVLGWPFKFVGLRGNPDLPPVPRALTALGPAYIKFGQILSTRPDVVGSEMAAQLRFLQDKLPAFPLDQAKAAIKAELGENWDYYFSDISEPVAAASIAQVHKAHLKTDGTAVAVKVLRPDVEKAFRRDIDAFYLGASLVEIFAPFTRRLRPREVIKHFEGVVNAELDLRVEGAACAEFVANTEKDAGLKVPATNFAYSARRVMTMTWAEGIPFGDVEAIRAAGHDMVSIGNRTLELFLNHALRDGYFHADMHQGNLMVAPNGEIITLDFGIMGRIDEYTRRVYAEILLGFISRNYRRVAEVHFEAGYVPADKDVDEFAQALRSVGEPIFGMDATQISMGRLLNYLFEVTERFGMETRMELILLQRTMVVVEGVARTFNPQINIWQVARPVVEDYIKESVGPKALIRDLGKTAMVLARFGPKLPHMMEAMLSRQSETPAKPASKGINQVSVFALGVGATIVVGWVIGLL